MIVRYGLPSFYSYYCMKVNYFYTLAWNTLCDCLRIFCVLGLNVCVCACNFSCFNFIVHILWSVRTNSRKNIHSNERQWNGHMKTEKTEGEGNIKAEKTLLQYNTRTQCILHRQQWTPCAAAAATVTALLFTWITFQFWNEDEFILVSFIACLRVLKNPRLPLSVYHLWFFFIWQQYCLLLLRHSFTRIYHRYFRHVFFSLRSIILICQVKLCDLDLRWAFMSRCVGICPVRNNQA